MEPLLGIPVKRKPELASSLTQLEGSNPATMALVEEPRIDESSQEKISNASYSHMEKSLQGYHLVRSHRPVYMTVSMLLA